MTVYLVGAGPGDPGLLTVKGHDVLSRAHVVIYDRLSGEDLLDLAPPEAERIFVGKGPGTASTSQSAINDLLLEHGRSKEVVVRLKGGDPFVFARGAEELAVLLSAGIDVEVVPGITSAIAAPAYAGIPVTRRYSSTSFTVVTGHEDPAKEQADVNWEAIAQVGGTIVVLMGVGNLPAITERLIAGGLDPETPAAAVRWGTRAEQEVTRSTLSALHTFELAAPSVIVVGEVAADDLSWWTPPVHELPDDSSSDSIVESVPEELALAGLRVVVTRAAKQASKLRHRLVDLGAEVVNVPMIAIEDPGDGGAALSEAVGRLDEFDWVIATSTNGVRRLFAALEGLESADADKTDDDAHDDRWGDCKFAVIGPGSERVAERLGRSPDLVPERYVAEGLLEVFAPPGENAKPVLLAQAAVTRGVLVEGLHELGWETETVEAYRTKPVELDDDAVAQIASADVVAFASSSAVTNFVATAPASSWPETAVAIGPITAATAREAGFASVVEASRHSLEGLIEALVEWARNRPTADEDDGSNETHDVDDVDGSELALGDSTEPEATEPEATEPEDAGPDDGGVIRRSRLARIIDRLAVGLVIAMGVIAATIAVRWSGMTPLALMQGYQMVLLAPAWIVLVWALRARRHRLAMASFVLVVAHLTFSLPAATADAQPRWAASSPTFTVLTANVYYRNDRKAAVADLIMRSNADVVIINEVTPAQRAELESAGVAAKYSSRIATDDSNLFGEMLLTRLESFGADIEHIGSLWVPAVTVRVGTREVRIRAVHVFAPSLLEGSGSWESQMVELGSVADKCRTPRCMFIGDFNSSQWNGPLADLLDHNLVDAHDALGIGLTRSYPANGFASAFGPLIRLDHLLYGSGIAARSVRNLEMPGSDHVASFGVFAVRQ